MYGRSARILKTLLKFILYEKFFINSKYQILLKCKISSNYISFSIVKK